MRGRKPQPAAVKMAKGNPGRRPVPAEPDGKTPGKVAVAPRELAKDARAIWTRMAPELTRLKFLRETDLSAFARYCEHLARWWSLTKDLRKEGETYETNSAHGNMLRVNPKFMVRERIEKRLEPLEDRFGLTPGARMQIMQRLAAAPPALPAGGLFGETGDDKGDGKTPTPPVGPLGLLNRGTSALN